jgi:hypothetical protein
MAPPAATEPATQPAFTLSQQQLNFFETFGFLQIPGLFADDIAEITAAFDEVFARTPDPFVLPSDNTYHVCRDPEQQHTPREIIPMFLDQHERLGALRHDPRVVGVATALLGDDYEFAESDGNLFNCDVYWHLDAFGSPIAQPHAKLYFYLDPLDASTGALRMIPGTNALSGPYVDRLRQDFSPPTKATEVYGVGLEDIPHWSLDVQPGDLVVGNHRTLHGSFGGRKGRRLFTVNFRKGPLAVDGVWPPPLDD